MASILNAFRNIMSDSWWVVKIVVYALPIFFIVNSGVLSTYTKGDRIIEILILSVAYLGISSFMMYRNINNKQPILPGLFQIPEVLIRAVGVSVVTIPLYILYIYIMNLISIYCVFEPFVMFVIYACVSLFLSPFILIPAVLYSVNGKVLDSLNIRVILEASGNFSVAFLSFIIQYLFTIFLAGYLLYRLFTEMLTDNLALNITYSLFLVISILTFYSYCSDLYKDVIPSLNKKED